ncbi:MAG: WecB/TagA/CpsF family glycosyltransferase [Chthoniobacterales bacterium]
MNLPRPKRVNVLGVGVSAICMEEAVELIINAAQNNDRGYVTVTGVHGVMESQDCEKLRAIHNDAFLVTPDGMPMSWLGWLYGYRKMDRVYGPDLMLEIMQATRDGKLQHFFYGGADGVAQELKSAFEKRCPGVNIVGTYTPPFRPLNETEKKDLLTQWEESRPQIVWVGLSTPKQERFMAEYVSQGAPAIFVGVGAAFDFHTGKVSQAPRWMQRAGLEWFYRVTQEPKRLWKRYFINNPKFLFLIALQLLGLRKKLLPKSF